MERPLAASAQAAGQVDHRVTGLVPGLSFGWAGVRDRLRFGARGVDARVLDHLESSRLPWGIVTNKPAWLTDPLMSAMGLDRRAGCVISGDTCNNRKPHPEPILHACALLGTEPGHSWYIGDAGRDIQAGRAAGCVTVGALYGYLHPDDPPESWQADLTIDAPEQLLDLMNDDSTTA